MAYGCTVCGGKFTVENTANARRILTHRCGKCGAACWGPMIPATSQQAAHWLGRRSEIKLGRLVKLARKDTGIVVTDNKRKIVAAY